MPSFSDQVIGSVEEAYEEQLDEQDHECENCGSTDIEYTINISRDGSADGEGECTACGEQVEVEIDDDDARGELRAIQDQIESLEDTLDDF
ncbi:hypothetical protein EXE51_15805 [Halorubrum sp. CGM5_25_10-8B]|uniref:hypothetical protein n=1 Tax=Halorubrum sp. CGM5_25_10-8B TaxID=2518115 RepID=UPI0010F86532|nr:hypothetical protein [Halorubrum sp. CGM5_25_10-8B]TKX35138.1 hypothetical protein EXE51_15805 [Halorubrum sp. CGM5_25_10-8B]